jgi:ubiquitin-conjugating enzyme E2 variant
MAQFDVTKKERVEAAAISAACALWLALALRWFAAAQWTAALPWTVLLAAILGVLAADLLSGVVHFACDRFFSERTALIGRTFIAPFREHHGDPAAIARHGFCERNGNGCIALLPMLIAAHAAFDGGPARLVESALTAWLLALSCAVAATNEVHAFAHRERAPALVRSLQRAGVILSPAAHRLHHTGGHGRAFCITTGWCNPLLDTLSAFARLEAGIRRVGRAVRRGRAR